MGCERDRNRSLEQWWRTLVMYENVAYRNRLRYSNSISKRQ
jgi:hypothetical protein